MLMYKMDPWLKITDWYKLLAAIRVAFMASILVYGHGDQLRQNLRATTFVSLPDHPGHLS